LPKVNLGGELREGWEKFQHVLCDEVGIRFNPASKAPCQAAHNPNVLSFERSEEFLFDMFVRELQERFLASLRMTE
jgi:hypothetical protein